MGNMLFNVNFLRKFKIVLEVDSLGEIDIQRDYLSNIFII